MEILKMKINNKVLLFLILAGILFRIGTLFIQDLWFDEVRQFRVAQGMSVFYWAEIDSKLIDTNLVSLCRVTLGAFLGSPFFTILLHYWSKLSSAEAWLRVLPLLFSIGILPVMYRLALACNLSKTIALFVTAFCSWNGAWVFYSVELRPYSLEIFCVALTLLLFINILRQRTASVSHYLWLSLSMLMGVVSGYGYLIFCVLIVSCAVIQIARTADTVRRKFIKMFLIITPAVVSFIYVNYITSIRLLVNTGVVRIVDIATHVTSSYLLYLYYPFHSGFGVYLASMIKSILFMMAWQLFYIGRFQYRFLNHVSIGLPFFILAGIIFFCMILFVFFFFKKRRREEVVVLVIFLGTLAVSVVLSTLRLLPMGAIRQNLFLSPVLLMSFFIILNYLYRAVNQIRPGINWNYCLLFILIFMIILNLLRVNQTVAYGRNGEAIRPLLKMIEKSYHEGDKVCVYINNRSVPAFIYEWQYPRFFWLKDLQKEDIYRDSSFRAGLGSGYDYQWYIFTRDYGLANNVRESLIKEGVILEEYTFFPDVIGFKVKMNSEKYQIL